MKPEVERPRLRPLFGAIGYPLLVAAVLVAGGMVVQDCEEATPAPVGSPEPDAGVPDVAPAPDANLLTIGNGVDTDTWDVLVTGKLIVGEGCRRIEIADGMVREVRDYDCEPAGSARAVSGR